MTARQIETDYRTNDTTTRTCLLRYMINEKTSCYPFRDEFTGRFVQTILNPKFRIYCSIDHSNRFGVVSVIEVTWVT